MGGWEEYASAKPSRMKLKETLIEQAEKIYRAEQRRQGRLADKVHRANGETGPRFTGTHTRFTSPASSTFQFPQFRNSYRAGAEPNFYTESAFRSDTRYPSFVDDDIHIPSRFAPRAFTPSFDDLLYGDLYGSTSGERSRRNRKAEDEVQLEGGPIPSMGNMSAVEFQAWVRDGMEKIRRQDDAWEREDQARQRERARREREAAIEAERDERERQERRARRRLEKEEADRKAAEAEMRSQEAARAARRHRTEVDDTRRERKQYAARWKMLNGTGEGGTEVVEVEMAFGDIPWPVYRLKGGFGGIDIGMLTSERVGAFLRDLAKDTGASERKVQMEAIRQFHPDRFFGRILPRVKRRDEEAVKEGVEKCSRVINALMSR